MKRREDQTISHELDTFAHDLKSIPTEKILLSGKRFKKYRITASFFTKLRMWPDKYKAEVKGIELAKEGGITVPTVVEHSLNKWGSITYQLITAPRLDQTLWYRINKETLFQVGEILSRIHNIQLDVQPNTIIFPRRNKYFLDDMHRRATIPDSCFQLAEIAYNQANRIIHQNGRTSFVHGDYGLQNIFDTTPLTVFDWEYSHYGFSVFDIGTCLSEMIFAVTEGYWDYVDYFNNCQQFLNGYKSKNINIDENIFTSLRFLSHRVPPQFYLFTLEKLAFFDNINEVEQILTGRISPEDANSILKSYGVTMDEYWGGKVLHSLSSGNYQPSNGFWLWLKKIQ
jgi:hypothetical protein